MLHQLVIYRVSQSHDNRRTRRLGKEQNASRQDQPGNQTGKTHTDGLVDGDQDTHAMQQAARLEQDLPMARVVIVEGANHYLWFSDPEVVIGAIQEVWVWSEEISVSK